MKKTLLYIGLAVVGYAIYKNVSEGDNNYGISERNIEKLQTGLPTIVGKIEMKLYAQGKSISQIANEIKDVHTSVKLVEVNGKYDSNTKKAVASIQKFLKDHGNTDIVRTDGVPDKATLEILTEWFNA